MLDPLIGATLIGGLFGIGGRAKDFANTKEGMALQHQYQLEQLAANTEAQKQLFQYQFDANNAYNDPSAVMGRLRNAGLNPNLVYSSGSAAGGVASGAMPNVSPGNGPSPAKMSDFGTAGDYLGTAFQNYARIKNETAKTKSDISLQSTEEITKLMDSRAHMIDALSKKDLNESEIKHINKQIDLIDSQIENIRSNTNYLDANTRKTIAEAETQELIKSIKSVELEFAPKLQQSMLEVNRSIASNNYAQASHALAQAQLTRDDAERLRQSWDYTLQTLKNNAIHSGLVNKETAQRIENQLQEYAQLYAQNKLTYTTLQARIKSDITKLGFTLPNEILNQVVGYAAAYGSYVGTNAKFVGNIAK